MNSIKSFISRFYRFRFLLFTAVVFFFSLKTSYGNFLNNQNILNSYIYSYHPLITDDVATIGEMSIQYEVLFDYQTERRSLFQNNQNIITLAPALGLTDFVDMIFSFELLTNYEKTHLFFENLSLDALHLDFKIRLFGNENTGFGIKPSADIISYFNNKPLASLTILLEQKIGNIWLFINYAISSYNEEDFRIYDFQISQAFEIPFSDKFALVTDFVYYNSLNILNKDVSNLIGAYYMINNYLTLSFAVQYTYLERVISSTLGLTILHPCKNRAW